MMLLMCRRTQKLLELNESSDLPEWVRRHLQGCPRCRLVAERELDFRRVICSVRSEPVPVSRLEWSQVRMRLQPHAMPRERRRIPQYVLVGSMSMAVLLLVFIFHPFNAGEQGRTSSQTHADRRDATHQQDGTLPRLTQSGTASEQAEGGDRQVMPGPSSPVALMREPIPTGRRIAATHVGSVGRVDHKAGRARSGLVADTGRGLTVLPDDSLETVTRLEVAFAPSVGEELNQFHFVPEQHPGADALPLPAIQCESADASYLQVNYVSEANEAYAF